MDRHSYVVDAGVFGRVWMMNIGRSDSCVVLVVVVDLVSSFASQMTD